MAYTALKAIKVQKDDGTVEVRQPGDEVPEAANWPNVGRYVATEHLAPMPGTKVPTQQRKRSQNLAVDPEGRPITNLAEYNVERNLKKANDAKLEKLCRKHNVDPAQYRSRDGIREALKPLIMKANEEGEKSAAAAKRKREQMKAARRQSQAHRHLPHLPTEEEEARAKAAEEASEDSSEEENTTDTTETGGDDTGDTGTDTTETPGDGVVVDDDPDPELQDDGELAVPSADQLTTLDREGLSNLKNKELEAYAKRHSIDLAGATKKDDMVDAIAKAQGE